MVWLGGWVRWGGVGGLVFVKIKDLFQQIKKICISASHSLFGE